MGEGIPDDASRVRRLIAAPNARTVGASSPTLAACSLPNAAAPHRSCGPGLHGSDELHSEPGSRDPSRLHITSGEEDEMTTAMKRAGLVAAGTLAAAALGWLGYTALTWKQYGQ